MADYDDRFTAEAGACVRIVSQCETCAHRSLYDPLVCAAFSAGIPDPIGFNRVDHRQQYAGDGGIQWEPLPGMKHPLDQEDPK